MPEINEYKCNECGFSLPSGWGGYTYVLDENGARILCPHPAESETVSRVLGESVGYEAAAERVGFNSHCVCRSCLEQCDLDLDDWSALRGALWLRLGFGEEIEADQSLYEDWPTRVPDERRCPSCGSTDVRTVSEMVRERCPKCGIGTTGEIWTGIVT